MNDETRLEKLRWAIHGVKAPFSCEGTFVPDKPLTLMFRDKSRFTVQRAENGHEQVKTLQPLIDRCQPAQLDQRSANMLKGRDQLVAATALQAGLDVSFAPYLFETCVDETWQLERFPTHKETARMKRQMDLSDLESALPIRGASSEKVGDFGITWLEAPPSSRSGVARRDSNIEGSSELLAAGRLHSCEYCEWGYFGNEASDVDFYIYAALHVQIPQLGEGPRSAVQPLRRTTKKKAQSKKKSPGKSRKKKDRE